MRPETFLGYRTQASAVLEPSAKGSVPTRDSTAVPPPANCLLGVSLMKELRVKWKGWLGNRWGDSDGSQFLKLDNYGIHTYKQVLEPWFSIFLML